jgi:hypothetical protein
VLLQQIFAVKKKRQGKEQKEKTKRGKKGRGKGRAKVTQLCKELLLPPDFTPSGESSIQRGHLNPKAHSTHN